MHVHRVGHNIAIALCLKDRFRYYFVCLCVCVCVSPLPCVSCIAIAVAVCVAMGVIMLLSGCVGAAPVMHRDRAARQWHIAMARAIMSTDAGPDGDEVYGLHVGISLGMCCVSLGMCCISLSMCCVAGHMSCLGARVYR